MGEWFLSKSVRFLNGYRLRVALPNRLAPRVWIAAGVWCVCLV